MTVDAALARLRRLASSGWRGVIARAPRMSRPATGVLLALMILGGVVLRIQRVGYPFHYCFDEDQFVGAAHQFLIGVPDKAECCHPPLAKLFIGVGMLLEGNNPMGWRFAPLCFGLQIIVLVYLIAASLFEDRRAGWLAAAFVAADGFYLSYSRLAFPEGMLTCLNLWCMFAAISARGWGGVLASAVLCGLAASIKWVGLLVALPACFSILLLRRAPWYTIFAFAVVPFVHLGVWMIGLGLIGHPNDPRSVWAAIRERAGLHLGFAHHINPAESSWYTWPFLYHPLIVKSSQVGTNVRLASGIGNPLLWIAAHVCFVGLLGLGIAAAFSDRWRQRWTRWFDVAFTKAFAILAACWVCMMALWISGRIVTYWYHYLTSWGFTLILFSGLMARLDRRFSKEVLIFVLLVLAVSIYFAPVWAELPLSLAAAHRRLIFPLWQ